MYTIEIELLDLAAAAARYAAYVPLAQFASNLSDYEALAIEAEIPSCNGHDNIPSCPTLFLWLPASAEGDLCFLASSPLSGVNSNSADLRKLTTYLVRDVESHDCCGDDARRGRVQSPFRCIHLLVRPDGPGFVVSPAGAAARLQAEEHSFHLTFANAMGRHRYLAAGDQHKTKLASLHVAGKVGQVAHVALHKRLLSSGTTAVILEDQLFIHQ